MLKKFLQYLILFILLSVFGIILTNQEETRQVMQEARFVAEKKLGISQPCGRPLRYSIGSVDPKFNVSAETLKKEAQEAEAVWEKAGSINYLEYDPEASFRINLVYDERQEMVDAAGVLTENLNSLKTEQETIAGQYNKLSASLKNKISAYEKALEKYKDDVDDFNKDIKYWNSQGGAPQDEYDKLKKREKDLKKTYENLEQERKDINKLVSETNALASKENKIVKNYNSSINTYTSKYGEGHEFEKGIFNGEAINIYEFQEINDLRLTLVHEFGHYLGMDHVENYQSIMYPIIGEQDMENIQLTSEDMDALNNICK